MKKKYYCVLVLSGVLLCTTVGFQLMAASKNEVGGDVKAKLAQLDLNVDGWLRRDIPIAETEFLIKKTEDILQYDDYRYVEYTKGDKRITLYIAYWSKGKISPKEISWHNPDVCWVGNGYTRLTAKSRVEKVVGELKLPPAEEREYTFNGKSIYVIFWHLVDGRSRSVSLSGIDPWYAFLTDIMDGGFNIKKEQFFIRLGSDCNWDELSNSLDLVAVEKKVARIVSH